MKEKEDKWIQSVRKRLENYSEPLPDGLWKELEQELDASSRLIPLWRQRKWQAAAAVAVLAVSSLTVWFHRSHMSEPTDRLAGSVPEATIPAVGSLSSQASRKQSAQTEKLADASKPDKPIRLQQALQAIAAAQPMATEDCHQVASQPESDEGLHSARIIAEKQKRPNTRESDRKRMEQNSQELQQRKKAPGSGIEIGIGTGNTPYPASGSFNGLSDLNTRASHSSNELVMAPELGNSSSFSQMLMSTVGKKVTTDTKHHIPVTIGASVKWNLNEAWSLESGLSYTLLSSEQRSGTDESYWKKEYKLHYLGIPLKVHRKIWSNRTVTLYAAAGGMVEKCVAGKQTLTDVIAGNNSTYTTEKESLHVKPLQWSVSGAVGAQLNLSQQIGLYAEPGVAYYFDDGSEVQTIRKEHPFNFNLSLGLRFNIDK